MADVSAPLPDLDLSADSILTVDTGDNNAKITRLVIHVSQELPESPTAASGVTPLFAYGQGA